MGPFMVEIVYCRVTRRGRKKRKGMNKLARENCRNDGPCFQFLPPEDTVKVTLDLSENGPVFSALDDMMMKMIDDENAARKKSKGSDDAKKSLKRLLKSGIPGVEKMFAPPPDPNNPNAKKSQKGFHKMTDGSKQKFMKAIFGEDGTSIDSNTAAALLAATCSGGDPEIANNIAEILLPGLTETIDPTMMAALMSACSLINAGSNTEEVMKAMKAELASSGMSEEEILLTTQKLMKVFRREESSSMAEYSLASKQTNVALRKNETSPKDFTLVVLAQKAIAACGTTPENFAKVVMVQNQLAKRGAQARHIADAMKHQADYEGKRAEVTAKINKALTDEKLKKEDVFNNVRMALAFENENEPSWKEVRGMKDILQGASPNSPEAIELNLTRAVKTGGLKSSDIASALIAQKVIAALNVDAKTMAQIINMEKTIADNGVPSVEIARVLCDGGLPKELAEQLTAQVSAALEKDLTEHDVDAIVKLYDQLRLKSNIPTEIIEDIDKNLIQVRCSLEDVADNMVASQLARGEKEHMVIRGLCETLLKTGASAETVATTMMSALRKVLTRSECDIMKDTGRTMFEQGIRGDDLTKAMTELILNLLDENIELREEAAKAFELVLKEAGGFPDQIRQLIQDTLPPPPPRPMSPRLAAELERLRAEDDAREADKAKKSGQNDSDSEFSDGDETDGQARTKTKKLKNGKPKNPAVEVLMAENGSRRGSITISRRGSGQRSRCGSISLGGVERRGSFYSDDVSKRSTVAVVVDDPDSKKQMTEALRGVFDGDDDDVPVGANPGAGRQAQGPDGKPVLTNPIGLAIASSLGLDPELIQQFASGSGGALADSLRANADKLQSLFDSLAESGRDIFNGGSFHLSLKDGKISEEDVAKLLSVFNTSGVVSQIGGIAKFRTMADLKNTVLDSDSAFDAAMEKNRNRPSVGISDENRKLMEEILRQKVAEQQDITSRVSMLLAGSALTTTAGAKIQRRETVQDVPYDMLVSDNGDKYRRRTVAAYPDGASEAAHAAADRLTALTAQDKTGGLDPLQRSMKRTSLVRLRRMSDASEAKRKEEEEKRRIIGLRRAKVPLMVYSCGGFTRCFRVARYHVAEGPPIGVTYEGDTPRPSTYTNHHDAD